MFQLFNAFFMSVAKRCKNAKSGNGVLVQISLVSILEED